MPCYKPLTAYRSKEINESGKRGIVFNPQRAEQPDEPLDLPCGQCVGCRLERSRQWAIRCIHEAQMHEDNCFVTLTFNPASLSKRQNPLSLDKKEFQDFMKRLRKHFNAKKIRYFHCGEYGDRYGRPHYHAILFGLDFQDKQLHQVRNGNRLYTSRTLERIWGKGFCSIGDVTFESAAYVARYILKKVTGEHAWHHYADIDYDTGEIKNVKAPEYTTMSRRPGIAADWFARFGSDVYPSDFITVNGKKMRAPKYYDKLMEQTRPYEMEDIKNERIEKAKQHNENNTIERLKKREECQQLKIDRYLPRKLDHET